MLLSLITFLPLVFALLLCFAPKSVAKPVAFFFALVEFGVSLALFKFFDPNLAGIQLQTQLPWVPEFGITYFLAIDGLSFWLVLLSTLLTPLVILGSFDSIKERARGFYSAVFVFQTALIGSFLAMDAILFYSFFELALVPMYFMIGVWGGARKAYATVKFFVFTMLGSLIMLLAIIYLMYTTRDTLGVMSASVLDFYKLKLPFVAGSLLNPQTLLFAAFSLAFSIKVAMFPLHSWLPDAYTEAPAPATVLLSAVMAKMGSYGFIRFVLPVFPDAAQHYAWFFIFLGVVGIIYGALVAMVQPDIKKLIAYSSISHMGYILAGTFAMNTYGVTGSVYQMLNHGVSTGALFLLVGMLSERTQDRQIKNFGGLAKSMPLFTIVFVIVTMSSIAVPLTNGFIGEFLILLGTFEASVTLAMAAVLGVILGAVYMLWMVNRVFFGEQTALVKGHTGPLGDLNLREILVLAPLVILIFWMGLFPNQFLNYSKNSIANLVENRGNYRLTEDEPAAKAAFEKATGAKVAKAGVNQ